MTGDVMASDGWSLQGLFETEDGGLLDADVSSVARALRKQPGTWLMQREEAEDGKVILLLIPAERGAASFVIERAHGKLCLTALEPVPLGVRDSIEGLLALLGTHRGETIQA